MYIVYSSTIEIRIRSMYSVYSIYVAHVNIGWFRRVGQIRDL